MRLSPLLSLTSFLTCLLLLGCGSSGGSGGGSQLPPPPPPPVATYVDLPATVATATGTFAGQGNTQVRFWEAERRIVVVTGYLGTVAMVFGAEGATGYHGTFTKSGVDYAVWFWPDENHLSITATVSPTNAVAFLLSASNG